MLNQECLIIKEVILKTLQILFMDQDVRCDIGISKDVEKGVVYIRWFNGDYTMKNMRFIASGEFRLVPFCLEGILFQIKKKGD